MTPCGYDGCNYQVAGNRFYALDLWGDLSMPYGQKTEIDVAVFDSISELFNLMRST